MTANDAASPRETTLCPFIDKPDEDCYCIGMTSLKAFEVVRYCGNHFTLCSIYQRKMRQQALNGGKP